VLQQGLDDPTTQPAPALFRSDTDGADVPQTQSVRSRGVDDLVNEVGSVGDETPPISHDETRRA